jgi:5-hydroxyisourate hydrolase
MTVTTHVLDTSTGVPAAGIAISLYAIEGAERTLLATATTNTDGRTDAPLGDSLAAGRYELAFAVATYFAAHAVDAFYDEITVRFRIDDGDRHYHVPLLLSAWGYSTYRGS